MVEHGKANQTPVHDVRPLASAFHGFVSPIENNIELMKAIRECKWKAHQSLCCRERPVRARNDAVFQVLKGEQTVTQVLESARWSPVIEDVLPHVECRKLVNQAIVGCQGLVCKSLSKLGSKLTAGRSEDRVWSCLTQAPLVKRNQESRFDSTDDLTVDNFQLPKIKTYRILKYMLCSGVSYGNSQLVLCQRCSPRDGTDSYLHGIVIRSPTYLITLSILKWEDGTAWVKLLSTRSFVAYAN
ncbi:hypothetical protein BC629DRAFT_1723070 [Irpex lacteus]|nr:hypothetical protein BC629DRAFT_1723070 [Irpex lacteus]